MKFNQWTLGLAAVGAVSLASAVRADEAKLSALNTALSNTTVSGYVDVGANYTFGDQEKYNSNGKFDRFALNAVVISLDKPLDESKWASGYHIDINWGDDAIYTSESNIRQAYVALRTPVGNGIDWKIGVMDGITGYEGNTSYLNPNISRSYGYAVNPASFVGMLGTYKINDLISLTAGIIEPTYSTDNLATKGFVGAVSLTAPESWGFLKGSTLNGQTIQSFDGQYGRNNYSVNATLNTPVAGLRVGLSYDYVQALGYQSSDGAVYGVYATYQATDKLSFAVRGEYLDSRWNYYDSGTLDWVVGFDGDAGQGTEVTATIQYNLWANVISRVEFRWDHCDHWGEFGHNSSNSDLLALNLSLAYKF